MLSRLKATLALLSGILLAACAPPPDLHLTQAQVRDLLPGRDTTAGYFVLRNNSSETITLNGATSPRARAIEIHRSTVTGDRVRMQRETSVAIKPGEEVVFAPGGLHLMIFGVEQLTEPLPITLTFAEGQQVSASFSKLSN